MLPWGEPTDPSGFEAAVSEVEHRSSERWLAPTFQLWSGPAEHQVTGQGPDDGRLPALSGHHAALGEFLEDRGYRPLAATDVLWLDVAEIPEHAQWDSRIVGGEEPDGGWLRAVRHGWERDLDPATELVLRRLLSGVRSRFLRTLDETGEVIAVSKMSIVPDPRPGSDAVYGGLYSVWVHPGRRRQGLARKLLHASFVQARQLGLVGLWLQVEHSADAARGLYLREGFRPVAAYRYLSTSTSA